MSQPANPPDDARSILITGSSSGIGRATAERFASRGWRVFASMRNPEDRGAPLRARATEAGWRLTTPALDVTSDDSVAVATADILRETGGRLDVLINNAGYYQFGALEETSPDELRAQLETNVVGVQRVTRAVLPAMRARRAGTVVTLGSVSGRVAVPLGGPYHASKWALEGMIEALRLELIPFGVRVVLIEPGVIATGIWSAGRTVGEELLAGMPPAAAGTYRAQIDRTRRDAARAEEKGMSPSVVADVIARALTTTRPRPRYLVGRDARAAALLARLPYRIQYRLTAARA